MRYTHYNRGISDALSKDKEQEKDGKAAFRKNRFSCSYGPIRKLTISRKHSKTAEVEVSRDLSNKQTKISHKYYVNKNDSKEMEYIP